MPMLNINRKDYSTIACLQGHLYNMSLKAVRKLSKAKLHKHESTSNGLDYLEIKCKKENAPYLVIIHGFADIPESFLVYANKLKSKYNIILPYLPGFCKNALDENIYYDLEFYKNSIITLLESLDISQAYFIGHSLGAAISLKLNESNPELTTELCIINPLAIELDGISCIIKKYKQGHNPFVISSRNDFKEMKNKLFYAPDKLPSFFNTWFYEFLKNNKLAYEKVAKDLFGSFSTHVSEQSIVNFSAIKCTTTLIWSENDIFFPLAQGRYIQNQIQNSKLHIIKNSGHCSHLENIKDLSNVFIARFL